GSDHPLGLYLHVPFCQARCSYCAFYTVPWTEVSPFVKALEAEILSVAQRGRGAEMLSLGPQGGASVDTLYFGGGTPSLLSCGDLGRLVELIDRQFKVTSDAEITLEVNPETVTGDAAWGWRAAGITRISLGVQSLDGQVLRALGRRHDEVMIKDAVHDLRTAGFKNLSFDLIAGVNIDGFYADLQAALRLAPDHLSVYLLETDEMEVGGVTPLARRVTAGRHRRPDDDWFVQAYGRMVETLAEHGLKRYEISNFAHTGRESRHNLKYWRSQDVLGFGPGAHSLSGNSRYAVAPDLPAYLKALTCGRQPPLVVDPSGPAERAWEALFLALRLEEGLDLKAWQHRPGAFLNAELLAEMAALNRAGLMRGRRRLRLTKRGVMVSSEIFQRLLPPPAPMGDVEDRDMLPSSS
ncbi:MAG: radical SAM family heme chaperone HemW, partial [Acidobacteriota bacterium]